MRSPSQGACHVNCYSKTAEYQERDRKKAEGMPVLRREKTQGTAKHAAERVAVDTGGDHGVDGRTAAGWQLAHICLVETSESSWGETYCLIHPFQSAA